MNSSTPLLDSRATHWSASPRVLFLSYRTEGSFNSQQRRPVICYPSSIFRDTALIEAASWYTKYTVGQDLPLNYVIIFSFMQTLVRSQLFADSWLAPRKHSPFRFPSPMFHPLHRMAPSFFWLLLFCAWWGSRSSFGRGPVSDLSEPTSTWVKPEDQLVLLCFCFRIFKTVKRRDLCLGWKSPLWSCALTLLQKN